jgi:hypothetical protein
MEAGFTLPGPEMRIGTEGRAAGHQLRETIQISDTELKVSSLHCSLSIVIFWVVAVCGLVCEYIA